MSGSNLKLFFVAFSLCTLYYFLWSIHWRSANAFIVLKGVLTAFLPPRRVCTKMISQSSRAFVDKVESLDVLRKLMKWQRICIRLKVKFLTLLGSIFRAPSFDHLSIQILGLYTWGLLSYLEVLLTLSRNSTDPTDVSL